MYSYNHFKPGGSRDTSRMIHYVAEYNMANQDKQIDSCLCVPFKYDKNTPGSDSPSIKVSYARRISAIIQSTKGGTTQYGNFYLGQSQNVNYLGKMEGMPGGSGKPPVNRFN